MQSANVSSCASPVFSINSVDSDGSTTPIGTIINITGDAASGIGFSDSQASTFLIQSPSSSSAAAISMCTVVPNAAAPSNTSEHSAVISQANPSFIAPTLPCSNPFSVVPTSHAKEPTSLSSSVHEYSPYHHGQTYVVAVQADTRLF